MLYVNTLSDTTYRYCGHTTGQSQADLAGPDWLPDSGRDRYRYRDRNRAPIPIAISIWLDASTGW